MKHSLIPKARRSAFTLIELLVVIAIIAILAAVLLPVLEQAKQRGINIAALNNIRQLDIAWKMYATDNQGALPPNPSAEGYPAWVAGQIRGPQNGAAPTFPVAPYTGEWDATNVALLMDARFSVMGGYVQDPKAFKDPGDYSTWDGQTRTRSFSMSCAVGNTNMATSSTPLGAAYGTYRLYRRESDMIAPSPAELWVFLDEHPDSINDGFFSFNMPPNIGGTVWVDMPAAYHNGACAFAFADGHCELHKWIYPGAFPQVDVNVEQTATPIKSLSKNNGGNPDVLWVAHRTSALLPGAPPGSFAP